MSNSPKRILLVTRNLPPLVGGMETLLQHCAETLCSSYSVTVVGPRGCSQYLDDSIEVIEAPTGLPGFLLLAPFYILSRLYRQKFDLVFGGSGLMAPACWLFGKLFGAATLCYVHGLDIVVSSRVYQALFLPCLRCLDAIVVNSRNTRRLSIEAGIEPGKISIIHPGCEIPGVVDRALARQWLRSGLGVEADFCLLFVGRIAPRKGLLAFMRCGFAPLLHRRPDTVLLIAGDSPEQSLAHRSGELASVAREVEENGWADRVRFLGKIDDDTLSLCYAAADCLLFPLVPVPGDVEGFGMVAIEAAARGTPTVAFDEGGVSDAVSDGISGRLVPSGNYGAMVDALAAVQSSAETAAACREHARKFGWDVFDPRLLQTINEALSDKR